MFLPSVSRRFRLLLHGFGFSPGPVPGVPHLLHPPDLGPGLLPRGRGRPGGGPPGAGAARQRLVRPGGRRTGAIRRDATLRLEWPRKRGDVFSLCGSGGGSQFDYMCMVDGLSVAAGPKLGQRRGEFWSKVLGDHYWTLLLTCIEGGSSHVVKAALAPT